MKLKEFVINYNELQDYLDKYQDKIKFMFYFCQQSEDIGPNQFLLIIDVS